MRVETEEGKKREKGKKYVSLQALLQMPAPLPPVNISHQRPLWLDPGLQEGGLASAEQ